MDNRDFSNIGEKIKNTVEDAMNSMDYQQLNQKISRTVDMAMNEAKRQLQNFQYDVRQPYVKQPVQNQKQPYPQGAVNRTQIRVKRKGRFISIPMMTFGIIGTAVSLIYTITFLAIVILGERTIPGRTIGIVSFGGALVALILSVIVLGTGAIWWNRYNYFKKYLQILDGREFCPVKELSEKTKQPLKTVCKKLRKMIRRGMFIDGFLDDAGTCLIVTKGAYQQFCQAQEARRLREAEEIRRREEQQNTEQSEIDKMIQKGNEYIRDIRMANDAIPGVVISAKLDRLELVIRKIFESVKKHPEQMNEMDRFMEYYLPTTQKLVNAYREFDALPVKGENVTKSMTEIENTLDTISSAFEKLLDDLFQDTAFDISSDISVLQTMLAREGYKEKDFK